MELGGHWRSGLRQVSAPLKTWTFFELYQTPKDTISHIQSNTSQLQSYSLKISLHNYVTISDLNQSYKHPYFLPAPIIIQK